MADLPSEGTIYNVTAHGPGGQTAPAGVLAVDADQRLSVVKADPRFVDLLELATESLNDTETFMVRAAPPPDAEPLTLYKRAVARSDADAGEAVIALLRRDYGLELTRVD